MTAPRRAMRQSMENVADVDATFVGAVDLRGVPLDLRDFSHYLAASRAAALIQLGWCVQPMVAGAALQDDTAPRAWPAACSKSMRCGWAVVPHSP